MGSGRSPMGRTTEAGQLKRLWTVSSINVAHNFGAPQRQTSGTRDPGTGCNERNKRKRTVNVRTIVRLEHETTDHVHPLSRYVPGKGKNYGTVPGYWARAACPSVPVGEVVLLSADCTADHRCRRPRVPQRSPRGTNAGTRSFLAQSPQSPDLLPRPGRGPADPGRPPREPFPTNPESATGTNLTR